MQQYDRDELYQKIWDRPLTKVAEEYGVSAVALGKVCRKLSVPLPGRGYWAKLAHGQTIARKPPLPKLDNVPVIYRSIAVQKPAVAPIPEAPEFVTIDQLLSSGALEPVPFEPSAEMHALARRTANRLRSQSRKNEQGILLPREPDALDVKVTFGSLDRALQVMSRIVTVIEKQGFAIDISEQEGTGVRIYGQRVRFGIEESVKRVVTQKARVPHPTDRWDYDEIVSYELTGMLALVIYTGTWTSRVLRKTWADTKGQRVENLIPSFVAGLMRTAVVVKQENEERERREVEQKRRAEELTQLRKEIETEEKKLEQFNHWVDDWEKAERLRRFIAVYAEKCQSWSAEKQPQYQAWIEWANIQADRLDPFVADKPASVLDRKHELRGW